MRTERTELHLDFKTSGSTISIAKSMQAMESFKIYPYNTDQTATELEKLMRVPKNP